MDVQTVDAIAAGTWQIAVLRENGLAVICDPAGLTGMRTTSVVVGWADKNQQARRRTSKEPVAQGGAVGRLLSKTRLRCWVAAGLTSVVN